MKEFWISSQLIESSHFAQVNAEHRGGPIMTRIFSGFWFLVFDFQFLISNWPFLASGRTDQEDVRLQRHGRRRVLSSLKDHRLWHLRSVHWRVLGLLKPASGQFLLHLSLLRSLLFAGLSCFCCASDQVRQKDAKCNLLDASLSLVLFSLIEPWSICNCV